MLCYIADLGLSIELDEADDDSEIGIAGSRFWLAPEMIRGDGYGVKVRSYNLINAIEYIFMNTIVG
jgi:serine/threonine protein kinase